MSVKDYKAHEQKRVNTMTERQLITRYGKMTDLKKIKPLLEVLRSCNTHDRLRQLIEQDHPELTIVNIGDVKNEWVVFRENEEHGFNHEYITFTQPMVDNRATQYLLVSKASPMRVHNETVQHSTQNARQLWAHLMKEGWRQEVL